eukprot:Gregarina_sp_Poly_1__9050@NODE_552_length_7553_cov_144_990516_g437_i0_p1_GENE_NODE_552_length_7553_cov_144_990516_g437_i0NODE_552_length_7553_cov_144_990516_g437_i0_p1_ORF_typecomplete_len1070_score163_10AMPbinding/PF00501_28/6_3e33PPbinding/PF00550_25/7_8e10PPbinding/PF00550_25/2e02_NODE_552_length_7553_cov_144_990516_g437_i023215530
MSGTVTAELTVDNAWLEFISRNQLPFIECPSVLHMLEYWATVDPNRVGLSWPLSGTKFTLLTFRDINTYTNVITHQVFHEPTSPLRPLLQLSPDPEIHRCHGADRVWIGVLLEDARDFFLYVLAFLLQGFSVLLLSPRNSVSGFEHLLKEAHCQAFVASQRLRDMATAVRSCPVFSVGPLNLDVLRAARLAPCTLCVPLSSPALDEWKEVRVCLHTSGSSRHPRCVFVSNRYILANSSIGVSSNLNGFSRKDVRLAFAPLFHTLSFLTVWGGCLVSGVKVVIPVQLIWPPTVEDMLRTIQLNEPTSVTFIPLLMQMISIQLPPHDPRWQILRDIKSVTFGGAPIPAAVLQRFVDEKVNINSGYGQTESGCSMMGLVGREEINPLAMFVVPGIPHDFIATEGTHNELFELAFRRDSITLAEDICNSEYGFRTGDLFKRGPLKDLWIFEGRADDRLTHTNGEKTNPIPIETGVAQLTFVKTCAVLGNGRPVTSCLVELDMRVVGELSLVDLMDALFKCVLEMNRDVPMHSRILREMVYVIPLGKSIPLTTKGTPHRSECEKVFKADLDKLYAKLGESDAVIKRQQGAETELRLNDKGVDKRVYRAVAAAVGYALNKDPRDLEEQPDTCFFELGMDSHTALAVRDELERKLRVELHSNIAYEHPTPRLMAEFLAYMFNGGVSQRGTEVNVTEGNLLDALGQVLDISVETLQRNKECSLRELGLCDANSMMLKHLLATVGGVCLPEDFLRENDSIQSIMKALHSNAYPTIKPVHSWSDLKFLVRRFHHLARESKMQTELDPTRLSLRDLNGRLERIGGHVLVRDFDEHTMSTADILSRYTYLSRAQQERNLQRIAERNLHSITSPAANRPSVPDQQIRTPELSYGPTSPASNGRSVQASNAADVGSHTSCASELFSDHPENNIILQLLNNQGGNEEFWKTLQQDKSAWATFRFLIRYHQQWKLEEQRIAKLRESFAVRHFRQVPESLPRCWVLEVTNHVIQVGSPGRRLSAIKSKRGVKPRAVPNRNSKARSRWRSAEAATSEGNRKLSQFEAFATSSALGNVQVCLFIRVGL